MAFMENYHDFHCDKNTTCCFTGHRRRDLPFCGDIHKQGMKCLVSMLQLMTEEACANGYDTFLSGMADGIDLICAEIVHNLKSMGKYPNIKLVCVIPYENQYKEMYTDSDKYIYSMLTATCDEKIILSQSREKGCYRIRNKFMTDHSSLIIGAMKYKSAGSGTLQTVNLAKAGGLTMKIISLDKNSVLNIDTDKAITDFCTNQSEYLI